VLDTLATLRRTFTYICTHSLAEALSLISKNIRCYIYYALNKQFDRRFKVDTAGRINLENLSIESENKIHGVYYEPTPRKVFYKIFSGLILDHREFEFIDFGCGKGRVLFLAARYPFRKITGVEFSPELVRIARRNITTFRDKRQKCKNIEVLCMDALEYNIPGSKAILYFFNPFNATAMDVIAKNLQSSFMRDRTKKIIIYYHPQSVRVFEKLQFLKKIRCVNKIVDLASPQFRGFTILDTADK